MSWIVLFDCNSSSTYQFHRAILLYIPRYEDIPFDGKTPQAIPNLPSLNCRWNDTTISALLPQEEARLETAAHALLNS
jgi:hypothetical protein